MGNASHWFEIPVADLGRATDFYQQVLGVDLSPVEQGPVRMAWFPREAAAHGSAGGLIQADGRVPSRTGTLVYLTVPNLDAALSRVQQSGGKVVLPSTSGEYGSIAHFEDSEGNLVALFSES